MFLQKPAIFYLLKHHVNMSFTPHPNKCCSSVTGKSLAQYGLACPEIPSNSDKKSRDKRTNSEGLGLQNE